MEHLPMFTNREEEALASVITVFEKIPLPSNEEVCNIYRCGVARRVYFILTHALDKLKAYYPLETNISRIQHDVGNRYYNFEQLWTNADFSMECLLKELKIRDCTTFSLYLRTILYSLYAVIATHTNMTLSDKSRSIYISRIQDIVSWGVYFDIVENVGNFSVSGEMWWYIRYPIEYLVSFLINMKVNSTKHGKAKNFSVNIQNFDTKMVIIIQDDGLGYRTQNLADHPEKMFEIGISNEGSTGFWLGGIKTSLESHNGSIVIIPDNDQYIDSAWCERQRFHFEITLPASSEPLALASK